MSIKKFKTEKVLVASIVVIALFLFASAFSKGIGTSVSSAEETSVKSSSGNDEKSSSNNDEDEKSSKQKSQENDEPSVSPVSSVKKTKTTPTASSAEEVSEKSLQETSQQSTGEASEDKDEVDDDDEIRDLARDIVKMEIKLNVAEATGVNVSALKNSLDSVKILLAQAQEKFNSGDIKGANVLKELGDKKLDAIKKSLEAVFNDDDDEEGIEEDENELEDEAKEYKNKVAQFVHNLKELGGLDGRIGQQVKAVAQAQNDDIDDVEESINDIKERGKFAKFFIGPKYDSIAEIKTAITENQARIKVLTEVMNQITDPAIKLVLQDQINNFQQENNKLQAFIVEEENIASVFGWLIRMFQ